MYLYNGISGCQVVNTHLSFNGSLIIEVDYNLARHYFTWKVLALETEADLFVLTSPVLRLVSPFLVNMSFGMGVWHPQLAISYKLVLGTIGCDSFRIFLYVPYFSVIPHIYRQLMAPICPR